MHRINISILIAVIFGIMVFFTKTASSELIAVNGLNIPPAGLIQNTNYQESILELPAGNVFDAIDFTPNQLNISLTVKQARVYREAQKFI